MLFNFHYFFYEKYLKKAFLNDCHIFIEFEKIFCYNDLYNKEVPMKKIVILILCIFTLSLNLNVLADEIEDTPVASEKSSDKTLTDIYVNGQKIVCSNFVCEHIVTDNKITKVVITYKTNDTKASVSKNQIEGSLKEGVNEFSVTVTAEDQSTQDYTFKITKQSLSTDSSLKKITINGEEISLKSGTFKYSTTVSYSAKKIEIEATPNNANAKIEEAVNNKLSYDFFDDKKEVRIKVISEAGDVTTYVITVSRRDEEDASLKSLNIEGVKFDFESLVFDYEITVLKSVDALKIDAVPNDSKAKVTIDNPTKLQIGLNEVKITVENDGNTNTYTLKVTKISEEDKTLANLKSLKIAGYELDFKEDKYEYDLEIGDVNYLNITPEAKMEGAEVDISGNLDLVNGSIIKIRVTYDDEITNVYTINIIKAAEENKQSNTLWIVILIITSILFVGILVFVIIYLKKKKNKNKNKDKNNDNKPNDVVTEQAPNEQVENREVVKDNVNNQSDIITFDDDEII